MGSVGGVESVGGVGSVGGVARNYIHNYQKKLFNMC